MKTHIKKIITSFFLLSSILVFGQAPTDEDIRFDRKEVTKEIYDNNPGVDTKILDRQIEDIRIKLVERYDIRIKRVRPFFPFDVIWPVREEDGFTGCSRSNFNSKTPFSVWTLANNIPTYLYTDPFTEQVTNNFSGTAFYSNDDTNFARFEQMDGEFIDQYIATVAVNNPSIRTTIPSSFVRVGNKRSHRGKEMISRSFVLNSVNDVIFYDFAIVLQDPGHSGEPFYRIAIRVNNVLQACSEIVYIASSGLSGDGFLNAGSSIWVKPWSSNVIKPADFGATVGSTVTVEISASDCDQGGHFGYGYFDIQCVDEDKIIVIDEGEHCIKTPIRFRSSVEMAQTGYIWKLYNSNNVLISQTGDAEPSFTFTQAGQYTMRLEIPYFTTTQNPPCNIVSVFSRQFTVSTCEELPCQYCASFNPLKGEKYVIEGWVKEKTIADKDIQLKTYDKPFIKVSFTDSNQNIIGTESFHTSGAIIDGWQKILGEFTIPEAIDDLHIELENGGSTNVTYFDDIRVFPFNGTMKSYVYDPETQLLQAELDENNYATFYEYDGEGKLTRVKKETVSGRRTIQESRSGNSKKTQ